MGGEADLTIHVVTNFVDNVVEGGDEGGVTVKGIGAEEVEHIRHVTGGNHDTEAIFGTATVGFQHLEDDFGESRQNTTKARGERVAVDGEVQGVETNLGGGDELDGVEILGDPEKIGEENSLTEFVGEGASDGGHDVFVFL